MVLNGVALADKVKYRCKFYIRYLLVMLISKFYSIVNDEWHLYVFGWGNDEYYLKQKTITETNLYDGKKFYINKIKDCSKHSKCHFIVKYPFIFLTIEFKI
jgi:hypothetical protein